MSFTIATVNVNGLRAAARKGMGDWLASTSADVITLQEVRAPEELLAGLVGEGWTIVGGWATAYDKGRSHPVHIEVALEEYDQHNSMWESKPATMIRKVAKAQALRELYPGCFKGTYVAEEMPAEDPRAVSYDVPEPDVPDFDEAEAAETDVPEFIE